MLQKDKSHISLRLPTELVQKFDKIAEYLERDRTWVILQALNQYFEEGEEGADLLDEAEGYAKLDRGEGIQLDEVIEGALMVIEDAEKRRAG